MLQSEEPPPLAILDWMMPKVDGVELCRRVRMCYAANPLYIILLTARDAKDDMVIGLNAGADDYLGKPFHREELRARVNVGRRFAELNQNLLETQRSLEILARTDPLTGTLNRRAMLERLSEEMARTARENAGPGLAMVDIDHFKHINDTYGYDVGDHALMSVVGRAAATLLEVTVSIGGAISRGESAEALTRATDVALYQAKALGRNNGSVHFVCGADQVLS